MLGEPEETTGAGLLCPQAEGMGVGGAGTAPSQSLLLGRAGGGRRPSLARLCAQGLGTACLDHTEQCPWMCSAAARPPPPASPREAPGSLKLLLHPDCSYAGRCGGLRQRSLDGVRQPALHFWLFPAGQLWTSYCPELDFSFVKLGLEALHCCLRRSVEKSAL